MRHPNPKPWRAAARVAALCVVAMVAAGSAATSGLALSRPAPAQAAAQEPQDQFVPVRSLPQAEQLPAAPLLMTAYAFVWAALLVYVWTLWRRVLKVEREMRDLSARISEVPRGK